MTSTNLGMLFGGAALFGVLACSGKKTEVGVPSDAVASGTQSEGAAPAASSAAVGSVSSGSLSGVTKPGASSGSILAGSAATSSTAPGVSLSASAVTSSAMPIGTSGPVIQNDAGTGPTLGVPKEKRLAALPQTRQEHGVVALKGKAYVLGGYAPSVTASVIAYSPEEDKWASVTDFPSTFNHPNAVVIEDMLYVAGFYAGTSLTGPASGQNYVYDPDADKWSALKAMPAGTERAGSCVAALDSKIYIFGGGTNGDATTFASVYDLATDSWTELPALVHSREHCSAFASNGKLYILGGRTHSIPEFRAPSLEFDPATKKYTDRTPIPTPRGGAAAAVIAGRLFLFGGEGSAENGGVFDEVEAYDAATDAWESFPSLLVPRHGYGAAYIDGRVYLAGGATKQGGAASDVNTVYYFE